MLQDRVIVSELVGALGNQLFSWAAGYSISKRLDFTHYINSAKVSKHGCFLGDFHIEKREYPLRSNLDFLDFCQNSHLPPVVKLVTNLKNFDKLEKFRPYVFEEKSFSYDRRVERIQNSKVLRGYFQSWRYFIDDMDDIRQKLNLETCSSQEFKTLQASLLGQTWVAIHVRRKDYVSFSDFHGLTTPDYYSRALKIVSWEYQDVLKVVFSDDVEMARQVIHADLYIGSSTLPSPSENLRLMSMANCIIGSNSTFSWWSAFMMGDDKLVIFPRPWFASQGIDTNDLLRPNWLTVGNEK